MMDELPIVTRLLDAAKLNALRICDDGLNIWMLESDVVEATTLIEEMAGALREAPIIGRNESPDAFRKRQDEWLNGKCRQALSRVQP